MVSRPTRGTSLRFTTSSVSRRTVQRARPSGGQGDDPWSLLGVEQRGFTRPRALVQGSFQAALPISLTGQPHRLRGQCQVLGDLPDRLPLCQLPQSQGPQHRSHGLQASLQYASQFLLLLLCQLNLNLLLHARAISLGIIRNKYQGVVLFMWSQY